MHNLLSLVVSHWSLSLLTLTDSPIPQVTEHWLHGVDSTTQGFTVDGSSEGEENSTRKELSHKQKIGKVSQSHKDKYQ